MTKNKNCTSFEKSALKRYMKGDYFNDFYKGHEGVKHLCSLIYNDANTLYKFVKYLKEEEFPFKDNREVVKTILSNPEIKNYTKTIVYFLAYGENGFNFAKNPEILDCRTKEDETTLLKIAEKAKKTSTINELGPNDHLPIKTAAQVLAEMGKNKTRTAPVPSLAS